VFPKGRASQMLFAASQDTILSQNRGVGLRVNDVAGNGSGDMVGHVPDKRMNCCVLGCNQNEETRAENACR
jgi:hypothetical protein